MKFRPIFLCSVLFLFISCGVSQRNSSVQDQNVGDVSTGYLATNDGYVKINYVVENGQALFGGDMLLPQSQILTEIESSNLGLARESAATKLWPNRRVPYALPAKFPFSAELQHAISEWNKAGVSWVPRNSSDRDYVQFELDEFANYCGQSVLGRVGGAQKLRLPSGPLAAKFTCKMKHVLLHEMAHVLGFMHEHQRPDRDSFVKFEGSIASNYWLRKIEGSIPETPFDIESVTMYGSENTSPRMVTPDGKLIPLRNVLSARDIQGVKKIYSPPAVTTSRIPPERCLIVGGAGKVLHNKSQQRTECIAACESFETKNPKRSCSFGNEKLEASRIPPERCLIVGGAGKVLHNKSQQRTECIAACKSFETKNPKRSCSFGNEKLETSRIPPERCLIVGGAGKVLHNKSQQRTECVAACKSFETRNPKRSCSFGNEKLK